MEYEKPVLEYAGSANVVVMGDDRGLDDNPVFETSEIELAPGLDD